MVMRYTGVPRINPTLPTVIVSLTYQCLTDFYERLDESLPSFALEYSSIFTQYMGDIQRTVDMDVNFAYYLYLDLSRVIVKYPLEHIPPLSFIRIPVWLRSLSVRLSTEDL